MPETIAQHCCVAVQLEPRMRIAAGFLPLRAAAEILFARPYRLHGEVRVLVVYLWDVPGQAPSSACARFPFCDCPPPAHWEQ